MVTGYLNHQISIRDLLDFTGKVVLVTGSSRGIGAEMIKAFGSRGANCVVNYISDSAGQNKADAEAVAKELKDPLMIDCDVTNPQQVESMMKQISEHFGGLDILVNNSGIIRDRTIKKLTLEEFESVVRVNLAGTFNVTQKAAAVLRNGGRIVNMSSVSGQMGLFGQANYSSSKAAIIALTKVSAREFARQNITVNAIAPGFIDVGMSKGMPDEVTENFKKQIPLGRLGDVNEIVNAALFLSFAHGVVHHRPCLECEWRLLHGLILRQDRKTDTTQVMYIPRKLHSFLLAAGLILFCTTNIRASSATWKVNPDDGDWNSANNWSAGGPPNGPNDTAFFGMSNRTDLFLTAANTEVNGITYNADASAFTLTNLAFTLTISGVGVTNNSGTMQNFVVENRLNGGFFRFTNSATAGNLTTFTNRGADGTADSVVLQNFSTLPRRITRL